MDEQSLGPEIEAFLEDLVESGRYSNREEVLRESVKLMQARQAHLDAIDAAVARGIADLEAGRTREANEVLDELEAELQALVDQRRS